MFQLNFKRVFSNLKTFLGAGLLCVLILTSCAFGEGGGGGGGGGGNGQNSTQAGAVTAQDKQVAYEQLAVVGMLMVSVQKQLSQSPNPTMQQQMQQAGKSYLESFFGIPANKISITNDGIQIAP